MLHVPADEDASDNKLSAIGLRSFRLRRSTNWLILEGQ